MVVLEILQLIIVFNIIKTMILHQCLDGLTCTRAFLNLVKDDKRITLMKRLCVKSGKLCKEQIKICAIVDEQIKNILRSFTEINKDIALVFALAEFLGYITFADTPCTVNQN